MEIKLFVHLFMCKNFFYKKDNLTKVEKNKKSSA